ncbi:MAG: hypothetical protein FWD57_10115 [Polyangiaceae bacterium]|nr:hypothetical protein [Polyangiaceae bacterium]
MATRWIAWSGIKDEVMSPERQARIHDEEMAAVLDLAFQELRKTSDDSMDSPTASGTVPTLSPVLSDVFRGVFIEGGGAC